MKITEVRYGDFQSVRFIGSDIPVDILPFQGGTAGSAGTILVVGEPLKTYSPSSTEYQEQAQWSRADGIVAIDYENIPYSPLPHWPRKITGVRRATFAEMGEFALRMAESVTMLINEARWNAGWVGRKWIDRTGFLSASEINTARRLAFTSLNLMEKRIMQQTNSGIDLARIRRARQDIQ